MRAQTLYWPWWPLTFTTGADGDPVAPAPPRVGNRRSSSVRASVVAGAALLAILPVAAVLAT